MPRIYKLSRAGLRLLYKIRHHRGHGIHSPFVYNLVRKVIEEKTPYYAYDDLEEYLDKHPGLRHATSKYNRLSFRLINYFEAKRIVEIGSGYGINTLYLTAPATDIICTCIEPSPEKVAMAKELYKDWNRKILLSDTNILENIAEKQDCIFIDINDYQHIESDLLLNIVSLCHDNTFIVVKGIRTNKRTCALWKKISNIDGRTAMLDLFNIGIIFFNKKLYCWDYQISF